jgi:hypothetical protein
MVMKALNHSYSGSGYGRVTVLGQPRQKLAQPHILFSQKIRKVLWHMFIMPVRWEVEVEGSLSEASPRQKAGEPI